MNWLKRMKILFEKVSLHVRRFKKSHPNKFFYMMALLAFLALQGGFLYAHAQKQTALRERIEGLPTISLQELGKMADRGDIKIVTTHEVRSGSWFYPREKSYLEIENKEGKSFAWEKSRDAFMKDEIGKMMFESSMKSPILFKTGNVLVSNILSDIFRFVFFMLFIVLALVAAQSLMGEVLSGASFKAQKPDLNTTLDDVIGYPDVKRQLREMREQLLHPEKYEKRGVVPVKGILFTGDPGVGKTMMAKAFSNELGADFFTATGADFAEMYVGVGPKRVRSLFRQARNSALAVIFIDEIDALGSRNSLGNDSERVATINAMLSEMDGVNTNGRLVVIGATNHDHLLDPALKRPGRFDQTVLIPLPDAATREGILRHYLDEEKAETSVDLRAMALRTQGYSGARLKSIVLEAKRLAVREQGMESDVVITQELLQRAQEIALLGISEVSSHGEDLLRVAVHELGHALSGYLLCPELHVEKVTVMGRGAALGYAISRPVEERLLITQKQMKGRLVHYLAGRAAEEVVLGDVSGGAADDIKKANDLARDMVLSYGMGEETGFSQPVNSHGGFDLSQEAKKDIQKILNISYETAKEIMGTHKDWIKKSAEGLMMKGFLEHDELFRDITRESISFVSDEKWFKDTLSRLPVPPVD